MTMNKNTIAILLCSLGVVVACGKDNMGGDAAPAEKKGATLFFAGDSTLDDNGFKHPYRSWGRETAFYMKAGNGVANFAKSGASTKSFVANGYWSKLITNVKTGDFVLIHFSVT